MWRPRPPVRGRWRRLAMGGPLPPSARGGGAAQVHAARPAVAALPTAARPPPPHPAEMVARPCPLLHGSRPAGTLAVYDPELVAAMNVLDPVAIPAADTTAMIG